MSYKSYNISYKSTCVAGKSVSRSPDFLFKETILTGKIGFPQRNMTYHKSVNNVNGRKRGTKIGLNSLQVPPNEADLTDGTKPTPWKRWLFKHSRQRQLTNTIKRRRLDRPTRQSRAITQKNNLLLQPTDQTAHLAGETYPDRSRGPDCTFWSDRQTKSNHSTVRLNLYRLIRLHNRSRRTDPTCLADSNRLNYPDCPNRLDHSNCPNRPSDQILSESSRTGEPILNQSIPTAQVNR